ncbi:hypothetical protein ACVLV4_002821, partial [Rathayibacter agropyri]
KIASFGTSILSNGKPMPLSDTPESDLMNNALSVWPAVRSDPDVVELIPSASAAVEAPPMRAPTMHNVAKIWLTISRKVF